MSPETRAIRARRQIVYPLAVGFALITLLALAAPIHATTADQFTATLSAAAEVPTPGPAGAAGSATIISDDKTGEVCFDITVTDLPAGDTVTGAHIHQGAVGAPGDVVVALFTAPPSAALEGCIQDVDAEILLAIVEDPAGYYVNVHTDAYPDGAVRGQLDFAGVPTGPGTLPDAAMSPGAVEDSPLVTLGVICVAAGVFLIYRWAADARGR
jgi:hypothetical protein